MTRDPPLEPSLDLERHAPRALLLGLLLAGLLHGTAVAYGKLMPPLPKPKAAPRVIRPIDVDLVGPLPAEPEPEPIALDETTIEAPAPTPVHVAARPPAPKQAQPPPPPQMMLPPEPEPLPVTTAPPRPLAAYVPPLPIGPDRSSPARLGGNVTWRCPWPRDADPEMHHVQVRAQAQVRADGSASAITILDDPGYGFGREARLCALKHTYVPARGRDGAAIEGPSLPFFVHFDKY